MNLHLKVNKRILGISFVIVLIATIILSPVQKALFTGCKFTP